MHVNVQAPGESWMQICLRKARWATLIVYCPDFITFKAACEWQSARSSRDDMRKIGIHSWTTVHGHFADSGGFVLVSSDGTPTFPVNSRAIFHLVSRGYIAAPEITKDEILDKSKADPCTKVIATIQMTYLFCQVIARTANGLETTCLEITTVAFSLCALATSFFWLEKPKDVMFPVEMKLQVPLALVLQEGAISQQTGNSTCINNAGSTAWAWRDTPMDFVEQPGWNVFHRRQTFATFGGLDETPSAHTQRLSCPRERVPPRFCHLDDRRRLLRDPSAEVELSVSYADRDVPVEGLERRHFGGQDDGLGRLRGHLGQVGRGRACRLSLLGPGENDNSPGR